MEQNYTIVTPSLIAFKRRMKTLLFSRSSLISDSLTPVLILRDTVVGFIFSVVKCS